MKIVKQEAKIMPALPHLEQIAEAGKVCYQVDEVNGGPEEFFDRIMKKKHWSVMEMTVITLSIQFTSEEDLIMFITQSSKYMHISYVAPNYDGFILLVTASIRGWKEWLDKPSILEVEPFKPEVFDALKLRFPANLKREYNFHYNKASSVVMKINIFPDFASCKDEDINLELLNKHVHVMVKLTTNRAVSHEIVRHRSCSFLQESQRYCRYSDGRFGNEVSFICPSVFWKEDSPEYAMWERHCAHSEQLYLKLLEDGSGPQAARTVLPNSCKTELIIYANLEQWRHIFKLRAENKEAEPSMRELMIPLQEQFKERGWL